MFILRKASAFSPAKVPKQKKNNLIEKDEKKYRGITNTISYFNKPIC